MKNHIILKIQNSIGFKMRIGDQRHCNAAIEFYENTHYDTMNDGRLPATI